MTKPKKDIKFQHRDRRMSRGSMSDSPTEERERILANVNGNSSKSPTRNGTSNKQNRADAAAGWATDDEKVPVKELSEHEKKKQTFITRTIWTLVMIAFFFGSMFAGHIYMLIIVTAVQIISYKEVIAIANVPSRARSLRFTKTLNWYFLGSTMYFLYGESVIYYFKHIVLVDKVLLPFATHHRFISFMLYVMGMCYHAQDASHGSLARSRRATTSSNSPSSPGLTWLSTSLLCRRTSS
jgi:phosphatidate cytidylyltransferase